MRARHSSSPLIRGAPLPQSPARWQVGAKPDGTVYDALLQRSASGTIFGRHSPEIDRINLIYITKINPFLSKKGPIFLHYWLNIINVKLQLI
jgi:hypothetical protein